MYWDWEIYKTSLSWTQLKDHVLFLANYQCQCGAEYDDVNLRCRNTTLLEMHHDRYPLFPQLDNIYNVRILCRECHQAYHDFNFGLPKGDQYTPFDEIYRRANLVGFCSHYNQMSDSELSEFINNTIEGVKNGSTS